MMVENIRESDIIILVLTENYANKADSFEGGVGLESQLTLPLLMQNSNKLIPIMRHTGDYSKVFPFHLTGHYAIDFSNEDDFDEKFQELLYRLYEKPRFFKEAIGDIPTLEPKIPSKSIIGQKIQPIIADLDFSDLNLQILKRVTDKDIDTFMKDSFNQIIDVFTSLFDHIQSTNPELESYKGKRLLKNRFFFFGVNCILNRLNY